MLDGAIAAGLTAFVFLMTVMTLAAVYIASRWQKGMLNKDPDIERSYRPLYQSPPQSQPAPVVHNHYYQTLYYVDAEGLLKRQLWPQQNNPTALVLRPEQYGVKSR